MNASTLDLKPEYLALLCDILQAEVPTCEVRAYGSRVCGDNHQGSDLDLVVLPPAGVVTLSLFALRIVLQESRLPILVQVLDWTQIPASFREEIQRGYAVIQPGENTSQLPV